MPAGKVKREGGREGGREGRWEERKRKGGERKHVRRVKREGGDGNRIGRGKEESTLYVYWPLPWGPSVYGWFCKISTALSLPSLSSRLFFYKQEEEKILVYKTHMFRHEATASNEEEERRWRE